MENSGLSFVGLVCGGYLKLGCAGEDDGDRAWVDGRCKGGGGHGIVYLIGDTDPEETQGSVA